MLIFKKTNKEPESQILNSPQTSELMDIVKKQESEIAYLKAIQSAMPDPYYIRDMDYNVVFWPESIAKLMGYTEAEAKKMKCYDIFKAHVCPPKMDCPTQNCIKVKQFLKDVAVDVYHKNGSTVHTLVSNAGVYDKDGNTIGAVEIVKDNTVIQSSMNSIGQIIKNIESASSDLNVSIDKTENISKKVNEKAYESLKDIKTGVEAGSSISDKARNSSKYAGSVHSNMETINKSMDISIAKIETLTEKSEKIIEFVKLIQEISSKTNLLSINASIQAAHAGEAGKGFKVVADGIRELSKNSNESAQLIRSTIQEIMALIKETTNSINITENDITAGTNNISELINFVSDIAESSKVLLNIMGTIEGAVSATSELGDEQSKTVIEVEEIGEKLSVIAKELTHEFDRIIKAIQHADMG